jgi:hypothetical protein
MREVLVGVVAGVLVWVFAVVPWLPPPGFLRRSAGENLSAASIQRIDAEVLTLGVKSLSLPISDSLCPVDGLSYLGYVRA